MNNFETGLPVHSFFQGPHRLFSLHQTNLVDGDEPSAALIKFTWQMNVKMGTERTHTHTHIHTPRHRWI